MDFNVTFDVQTTKEPKVSGLIGHAISTGKKSAYVSETEIGIGQTSAWRINFITPKTSAAIYFEVVTSAGRPLSHGSRGLIQFVTYYQYSSGQMQSCEANSPSIASSFDQEATAVVMVRIAVFKAEIDDSPYVLRWLDRMLIRLCRSLQITGLSFDRHILNEDVNNSLIMIQPTMMSYTFDVEPQSVLPFSSSTPSSIFLFSTVKRRPNGGRQDLRSTVSLYHVISSVTGVAVKLGSCYRSSISQRRTC
ncbi:hypothetical protein BDR07DRAFT_1431197 [Suillus spraguei]|nr:hypothetical protein BDR07DRAFT_1431197 [Suillus spraguei]